MVVVLLLVTVIIVVGTLVVLAVPLPTFHDVGGASEEPLGEPEAMIELLAPS